MRDNKSVIVDFVDTVNKEGLGALIRFAEQANSWWIAGLGEVSPDQMKMMMGVVEDQLVDSMKFTVRDIIAEGDHVAAEIESYAELKSGKIYNNRYHFKFLVQDGKIVEAREYCDTRHAMEALGMG